MGCRSRSGKTEIYQRRILQLLVKFAEGRRRYRGCVATGTLPGFLRDGRRGGQSEPQRIWILVFVSPSVPELGRTVILRSATGQHDTTHVTLPHTICSRLWYQ